MSAIEPFIVEATRVGDAQRGTDPAWVSDARRSALDRFQQLGFPTARDEEWRFTSVAPIAETPFALARDGGAGLQSRDVDAFTWNGDVGAQIVFVNGRSVALSSSPVGAQVLNLKRALANGVPAVSRHLTHIANGARHAFTVLNTAFLEDGAVVVVPDNTVVEAPIHLLFLTVGGGLPTMAHPRVLIVMGANAQATIVESYGAVGAERYFTNTVTEIVAGANATLNHYKVQREHPDSFHVGGIYMRASRDSTLTCHSISLGGSIVRNDVVAVLDGEGATCTLNGLYLGDGSRLVDNHTTIDHARPHCDSREVYKGILADKSRAVFNGKIIVRPDAQKTDAKQTNKALLLSEDAQINTKPQLEIFANDVKCTHGAAIGQMDDDAIFYLRARGLGLEQARHMLIRAFAGDVLSRMPLEPLRARVDAELGERLAGLRA
jgi:Fe-S cluster assembly protein SufD